MSQGVKVFVSFRQTGSASIQYISKEITLATIPPIGAYFEYEDGWGLEQLAPTWERGMHLEVTASSINISGYGPSFSEEEVAQLVRLGWEVL